MDSPIEEKKEVKLNHDPLNVRDLNTYREGDRVDIYLTPTMINLIIERISDGGVTVSGGQLRPHEVISGNSPALYHVKNEEEGLVVDPVESPVEHALKSSKNFMSKTKDIKIPSDQFTVKQLAEHNNIEPIYTYSWVKDNCVECGTVERRAGQRGKVAKLFKLALPNPVVKPNR